MCFCFFMFNVISCDTYIMLCSVVMYVYTCIYTDKKKRNKFQSKWRITNQLHWKALVGHFPCWLLCILDGLIDCLLYLNENTFSSFEVYVCMYIYIYNIHVCIRTSCIICTYHMIFTHTHMIMYHYDKHMHMLRST